MYKLKQLIGKLTDHRFPVEKHLASAVGEDSKIYRFLNAITTQKVEDDPQAKSLFYGDDPHVNRNYAKLKFDLRQRLLDFFLLVDYQKGKQQKYHQKLFDCYRQWTVARILKRIGLNQIGLEELEKVRKLAATCGVTSIQIESNRLLAYHYSTRARQHKKYATLRAEQIELERKYLAELTAERYFQDIMAMYLNKKVTQQEIYEQCTVYLADLEEKKWLDQSAEYYFCYYALRGWQALSSYHYADLATAMQNAIENTKLFKLFPPNYLRYFLLQSVVANTRLQRYAAGKAAITQALKISTVGNLPWFKAKELSVALALHAEEYTAAWKEWKKTTSHPRFADIGARDQELWQIKRAYLWWLATIGKLKLSKREQAEAEQLRIFKLVNNLPIITADKTSFYLPVLIIQLLFCAHKKRQREILIIAEQLETYRNRYLKSSAQQRSRIFSKMLFVLATEENTPTIQKKLKRWHYQLSVTPVDQQIQVHEPEVLPYEKIWSLATNTTILLPYAKVA